jgi:hypothetical protein
VQKYSATNHPFCVLCIKCITTIRNQLKQESVEVLMKKRMLGWYGHAVRMDLERRPELVPEARPEGGRGRGRPRLKWEEYVERLACKRGRKLPEVKQLAQNRREYGKWLLEPTPNSKWE